MPLQVSSASFCDICYDSYSVTHRKSPHVLPSCGHIFCRDCLLSVTPSMCPLCRQPFRVNEILKLQLNISSGAGQNQALGEGVHISRSAYTIEGDKSQLNLIHQALHAMDMQSDEVWEDVVNTLEGADQAGEEITTVRQVIELWELATRYEHLYELEKERSAVLRRQLQEAKRLRRYANEDPTIQGMRVLFRELNPSWGPGAR